MRSATRLVLSASIALLLAVPPPVAADGFVAYRVFESTSDFDASFTLGGSMRIASVPEVVPRSGLGAAVSSGYGWAEFTSDAGRAGDTGFASIAFFDDLQGFTTVLEGSLKQYLMVYEGSEYPTLAVGVDTDVSWYFYVVRAGSGTADWTSVPRSFGWHQFSLAWAQGTGTAYVDGVPVGETIAYDQSPDKAWFGNIWGRSGPAAWDDFVFASYGPDSLAAAPAASAPSVRDSVAPLPVGLEQGGLGSPWTRPAVAQR